MVEIIVTNILGVTLAAAIITWFWILKPKATQGNGITIIVEKGTYRPSRISAKKEQPIELLFVRKDISHCAERVVFKDLELQVQLPLESPQKITLPPLTPGTYTFTCEMGMYRGEISVK